MPNAVVGDTFGGTGDTWRISFISRCSRHSWYGVGRFLEGVLVAVGEPAPLLTATAASLTALRLELDLAGGMGGIPGASRNDLETWSVLSTR